MRPISIEIGWKVDGVMLTCFPRLDKEEIYCLFLFFRKDRRNTFLFSRKTVRISTVGEQ